MKVAFLPHSISAVILTFALTACQVLEASAPRSNLDQKYQQMYEPTVVILNQEAGALGSGVIVKRIEDDYFVLTAKHVVEEQSSVEVILPETPSVRYTGDVLETSQERDLALIRVKLKKDKPVALVCASGPLMFEEVFAVGAGLAEPVFPTVGIVSNTRRYFSDYPTVRYLHHSAPIAPGNSGGPLYKLENGNYCLTGINLRGRTGMAQYSYALHLYEIRPFLRNSSAQERYL